MLHVASAGDLRYTLQRLRREADGRRLIGSSIKVPLSLECGWGTRMSVRKPARLAKVLSR